MATKEERAAKRAKPWRERQKGTPTQARHIPWPEIFKDHVSLIEGHRRMIEVVQKHTMPGTGDWNIITPLLEHTKEMLYATKTMQRNFVPPVQQFKNVPVGSSPASMDPSFLPADHECGEAVQEAGQTYAKVKHVGLDWKPSSSISNDPNHTFGLQHGAKRKPYLQKDAKLSNQVISEDSEEHKPNSTPKEEYTYFKVDTKPTPVKISLPDQRAKDVPHRTKSTKRPAEEAMASDKTQPKKPKILKEKKGEGNMEIEVEDIREEVEARLKEKEERRKKKHEKRKRESGDSAIVMAVGLEQGENISYTEKPKKKKPKRNLKEWEDVDKDGAKRDGY